jgi:hypothetical protein
MEGDLVEVRKAAQKEQKESNKRKLTLHSSFSLQSSGSLATMVCTLVLHS